MPGIAVLHQPVRSALPAPVHRGHGEAAFQQVLDDLEIFLDEFRSPLKDADRPLRLADARGPHRRAQAHMIGRRHIADESALRRRIAWNLGKAGSDLLARLIVHPVSSTSRPAPLHRDNRLRRYNSFIAGDKRKPGHRTGRKMRRGRKRAGRRYGGFPPPACFRTPPGGLERSPAYRAVWPGRVTDGVMTNPMDSVFAQAP